MIGLQMHRLARTRYSGSLAPHLAAGETLENPRLLVERRDVDGWSDRTQEFIEEGDVKLGPAGVTVEFWKRAAGEDEQLPGSWRITALADSSDGEIVVGWVPVEVVG